ncbi:MAG: AAA family ATPase [Burkholderiaceae bacterium]|nr:AAA family ATPase [Burkholderiaceae bacterium]
MYLEHFRLNAPPFSITPDTAFTFASRAQQEALATLLLAIEDGAGFIKITGEVGTGKTLACRRLLAALASASAPCETVYIPNPCLSPRTLLLAIALELRLPLRQDAPEHQLLAALNEHLLAAAQAGRRVVVCLDEAQAMPVDALEALRLLTNLETEKRKLMQVVLFGQPELDRKLGRADLRQLASRIAFQYRLTALDPEETALYLVHRLRVAGLAGESPFSPHVARLVHRVTRGVPRLVNIVAHKSLLLAYGAGCLRVCPHHVRAAAADTPSASRLGTLSRIWAALAMRVRPGRLTPS